MKSTKLFDVNRPDCTKVSISATTYVIGMQAFRRRSSQGLLLMLLVSVRRRSYLCSIDISLLEYALD